MCIYLWSKCEDIQRRNSFPQLLQQPFQLFSILSRLTHWSASNWTHSPWLLCRQWLYCQCVCTILCFTRLWCTHLCISAHSTRMRSAWCAFSFPAVWDCYWQRGRRLLCSCQLGKFTTCFSSNNVPLPFSRLWPFLCSTVSVVAVLKNVVFWS